MARRARPEGQVVYGIVQGGTEEDLRRASAQEVAARAVGGIAIGGSLGEDKAQMFEVVEWTIEELPEDKPRHLLGIGEVDDLVRGVELGIDTFDCAMPTRIGRHGMALVPAPERRWRVDLAKARWREADEPLLEGCPCSVCAQGYSRAYLHYLLRARELTAMRLLTLHNLAYLQRLMAELRAAVDAGRLTEVARRGPRRGRALGAGLTCPNAAHSIGGGVPLKRGLRMSRTKHVLAVAAVGAAIAACTMPAVATAADPTVDASVAALGDLGLARSPACRAAAPRTAPTPSYNSEMDALAAANPTFVAVKTAPYLSIEGRTIKYLEITNNVTPRTASPSSSYMGAIHGNETAAAEDSLEFAYRRDQDSPRPTRRSRRCSTTCG